MKFAYICKGKGETLIFIHSYLWDKNMWEPQIEFLKEHYQCISIDLPGHGQSDILDDKEEITLKDLAREITKFIDELKIEKYTYIGLSVGGMLAPYMYEYHKEKIKKIVIMDSYVGAEPEENKKIYFSMLNMIDTIKKVPENMAEKIAEMFFSPIISKKRTELYEILYNNILSIPFERINTIVKIGKTIFDRKDTMETLKSIDIPVVFITGEYDIPRPFEETKKMANYVKNSKVFLVENAGHISNLENSDRVNKIFKEIL
jgi:pimeloyl-ACP methyl ester carboxylesterase